MHSFEYKREKITFTAHLQFYVTGSADPKLEAWSDDEVRIVFQAKEQNLCPLNASVKIQGRTVVSLRPGFFTFKRSMLSNKAIIVLKERDVAKETLLPVPSTPVPSKPVPSVPEPSVPVLLVPGPSLSVPVPSVSVPSVPKKQSTQIGNTLKEKKSNEIFLTDIFIL